MIEKMKYGDTSVLPVSDDLQWSILCTNFERKCSHSFLGFSLSHYNSHAFPRTRTYVRTHARSERKNSPPSNSEFWQRLHIAPSKSHTTDYRHSVNV